MTDFNINLKYASVDAALKAAIAQRNEALETLETLAPVSLDTVQAKKDAEYAFGKLLGLLKADNDCRPKESRESVNGVPLETLINTAIHDTIRGYGLLSLFFIEGELEKFCKHGYCFFPSEKAITIIFEDAKPLVVGFAEGYSFAIREIAKESHVKVKINRICDDITKNCKYFLHSAEEYRIDGVYAVKRRYFAGYKKKYLNKGVYAKLQEAY